MMHSNKTNTSPGIVEKQKQKDSDRTTITTIINMESMTKEKPVRIEDDEDDISSINGTFSVSSSSLSSSSSSSSYSKENQAIEENEEQRSEAFVTAPIVTVVRENDEESKKVLKRDEDAAEEEEEDYCCPPSPPSLRRRNRLSILKNSSSTCSSTRSDNSDTARGRRRSSLSSNGSSSSVSFNSVTIRSYNQTIGDNPSVSYGTPISLDWTYKQCDPLDLHEYELSKPLYRRTSKQMTLSHYRRKDLLMKEYGFSKKEMKQAKKEANRIKLQRGIVFHFGPTLMRVETAVESIGRKVKRTILV